MALILRLALGERRREWEPQNDRIDDDR